MQVSAGLPIIDAVGRMTTGVRCDEERGRTCTLLIASEELLQAWSEHAARARAVIAVCDSDLAHVVEAIHTRRPDEVVLEQALAASPRGAPLMTVLRDQHRLRGLMVRLLSPERVSALRSSHPGASNPRIWLTAFARPLPPRAVQRAPRILLNADGAALLDGHSATLVDVSALGAQVQSEHVLRPNQQVRVVLRSNTGPLTVTANIVWSAFELAPAARYRAGIAFAEPVPHEINNFIAECSARWTGATS